MLGFTFLYRVSWFYLSCDMSHRSCVLGFCFSYRFYCRFSEGAGFYSLKYIMVFGTST